jgi:hypothetical protein
VPEVHSLNSVPFFAGLAIVAASIPVTLAVIASRWRPGSQKRRKAWTAAGMSALLAGVVVVLVVPEGYGSLRASDHLHIRAGGRELRSVGFPPLRPSRAIAALESWWGRPITPPEPVR